MLAGVRGAYVRHLRGRRTEASLVATGSYFLTLILVRAYTTLAPGSGAYVVIGGTHIHHVVFGLLALLVSGVLSLDEKWRLRRAALFGVGAALVLDEFALLVFLRDVYWLPQGWLSVVALLIGLSAMVVNALRSRTFIREVARVIRGGTDSRRSRRPR